MPFVGYYLKKILSFTKKAIIVFVTFFVILNLFFYFINRDKLNLKTVDPIKENRKKIYQVINNPQLKSTDQGKISIAIYRHLNCWLLGEACTDNPTDGNVNINHSLTGFLSGMIVLPLSQPPASGVYWAYTGLQNAGFVPKTYAADVGTGFAALAGIKGIWLLFRDFMMLLMVIIIIIIGFMIMFRAKINPQTVISIENSLPKIVIALLLITFSFAIAGFLIDLMYITIGFVVLLFQTNTHSFVPKPTELINENVNIWNYLYPFPAFTGGHFGQIYTVAAGLFSILPWTIQSLVNGVIYSLFGNLLITLAGKIAYIGPAAKAIGSANPLTAAQAVLQRLSGVSKTADGAEKVSKTGTPLVSIAMAALTFVAISIIETIFLPYAGIILIATLLVLSILFIITRIFFLLLATYVNTILLIILSPVILALEAIPGRSTFSSWLKNMIVNLMTFPIFVVLLFIARLIINLGSTNSETLWQPPFLISINASALQTLVGGFILFSIPDLIKMLKEATGIKPMPINLGLGSLFTGATSVTSSGVGLLGQISSVSLGLQAFKKDSPLGGLIRGHGPAAPRGGSDLSSNTAESVAKSTAPGELTHNEGRTG